jgi:PhzF family phenazine biosynthesis protein
MSQPILHVDAFTNKPFAGNPAAVCVLAAPQPDDWMQQVAQEMNLSETAFLVRQEDGFNLRWFTPAVEVPLCGHATLASAHVLWTEGHLAAEAPARFHTKSGVLIARQRDGWIELDFPANPSRPATPPSQLEQALGVPLKTVMQNTLGYLVELESEAIVRVLKPDINLLSTLAIAKVIVTSRADADSGFDFVSRFFAPGVGIAEDPVTGSAHCCLAPFWRDRLQQDQFVAYQASPRGGVLKIRYDGGDRVYLSGQAVTILRGELILTAGAGRP